MRTVTLNNGVDMPQLGLGVWRVSDDEAQAAVRHALDVGYRSIDTAALYENEAGVGRAIRESGVPRGDIFVTTKLWNTEQGRDKAMAGFEASLDRLGVDYVDLYLIHWPAPKQDRYVETWRVLEEIYASGRARAIGVSNFTAETLDRLIRETDVVPALNQIELHPYLQQSQMRAVNAEHGLLTEAWSPLGQGRGLLEDPTVRRLAKLHDRSHAQIVLRWHVQLGNVVIPKSVTPSRIAQNLDVFDFELTAEDMKLLEGLERPERFGPDPETFG